MESETRQADSLKKDDARPFGTTRSYWLHRRRKLFATLLKLITDTGTQVHKMCIYDEKSSYKQSYLPSLGIALYVYCLTKCQACQVTFSPASATGRPWRDASFFLAEGSRIAPARCSEQLWVWQGMRSL